MPLVPNYVPTNWVDGVTPVNEARMDPIDTNIDLHADAINALDVRLAAEEAMADIPTVVNGKWAKGVGGAMVWSDITQADVSGLTAALAAKEATANKGVASGYAPLDLTGRVPVTNLPPAIDLRFMGTYAGATVYKEGDVVISGGVAYMALRATTGETPIPWSTSGGAITYQENVLAADVAVSASNTFFTGPSLALPAGTWLCIGGVDCIMSTSGSGTFTAKLWDGASAVESVAEIANIGSSQPSGMALSGIFVLATTTTIRIAVASTRGSGGCAIRAAVSSNSPGPYASYLRAVKLA